MWERKNEYFKALWKEWNYYKYDQVCDLITDISKEHESIAKIILGITMPVSFFSIVIICTCVTLVAVGVWIKKKYIMWTELGLVSLIFAVIILGFITLTHATPQRICVCIVPLIAILIGRIVDNIGRR